MKILASVVLYFLTVVVAGAQVSGLNKVKDNIMPKGLASSARSRDASIAIVEVVGSDEQYYYRIYELGYAVDMISPTSGLETFLQYPLIVIPQGHASATNYPTFDSVSSDFIDYVAAGGKLWVSQPNPFQMPGGEADITWVPYFLRLYYGGDGDRCNTVITDPDHCMTVGLPDVQLSQHVDRVMEMASEWHVLVSHAPTGHPAVFIADYGSGMALIELGNIAEVASCPPDDEVLRRYIECMIDEVVATENWDWSSVKGLFR